MNERNNGRSCAIIVLGMHRSGTSALSGALRILGVELGSSLMLPEPGVNDKGFWEHTGIVDAHDRLLADLESRWDDICPLPDDWWKSEKAGRCAGEIKEILRGEFHDKALWSVKDPRMCRLLPLWLDILRDMSADPVFVLMVRHPREVARSLSRRDGFTEARSYALWLDHLCQSVKWSRGYPRTVTTYDRLLDDWRGALARIALDLSLAWPRDLGGAQEEIGRFLDPRLRHHRAGWEDPDRSDVPSWVGAAYDAVMRPGSLQDSAAEEGILEIGRHLHMSGKLFGPGQKELALRLQEMGERFSLAMELAGEREKELAAQRAVIDQIGSAFSEALSLLEQRHREFVETARELDLKKAELARREGELACKENELALMRSSRMWRLGQWIRRSWAGRLLERI